MSKTLEITKDAAKKAHKGADNNGKKLLEDLFGKDKFAEITEIVDSFEDICRLAGKDPARYQVTSEMDDEDIIATYGKKLHLIEKVLNEGVAPNYRDSNKGKWRPYFLWNGSGFGFSDSSYGFDYACAYVGSRFASQKLSDFAGIKFNKEFNDFIMATLKY